MATVALDSTGIVEVVEWPDPPDAQTLPGGATLVAGTLVRQDTNGAWIQALATTASNVAGARLLLKSVKAGEPGTAIRRGLLDGFNLASQAMQSGVFVSDTGTVADAAGTVSTPMGRVVAGTANLTTAARDKLLSVDLPV